MQEGKLSERALKRSVLRPLQQTVQKNHQNKAGTLEYGADCAALVEEAGCVTLFSTVNTVPGFEHAPDKLIVAAANGLAAAGAEFFYNSPAVQLLQCCPQSMRKAG